MRIGKVLHTGLILKPPAGNAGGFEYSILLIDCGLGRRRPGSERHADRDLHAVPVDPHRYVVAGGRVQRQVSNQVVH